MDEAVGGLEIEFKRVVNDLEYVSHHLEKDFRSRQATNGGSDVVALIRRISALESNLLTTKKRSEKLLSRRQQVTSMSASIMLSNHARLSRLLEEFARDDNAHVDLLDVEDDKENGCSNRNVNGDDNNRADSDDMNHPTRMKMEECREVRQELLEVLKECTFVSDTSQLMMMGGGDGHGTNTVGIQTAASSSSSSALPPPVPSATAGGPLTDSRLTSTTTTNSINTNAPTDDVTTTATVSTKTPASSSISLSMTTLPPFDVITMTQFEGVSSSTRGRCKLADCQVREHPSPPSLPPLPSRSFSCRRTYSLTFTATEHCQALFTRLVAHYTTTSTITGHKKSKKGGGSAAAAGSSLMMSLQSVPALSLAELGAMGLKVSTLLGPFHTLAVSCVLLLTTGVTNICYSCIK